MMAKYCAPSIPTSFASVFLISSLFALCFFSVLYLQPLQNHLDIHGLNKTVVNSTTHIAVKEEELKEDAAPTVAERDLFLPPQDVSREERIAWFKERLPRLRIFRSTNKTRLFDQRVNEFLGSQENNTNVINTNSSTSSNITTSTTTSNINGTEDSNSTSCQVRIFMTWIAPASHFGKRELLSLETVFKAHPKGCVVIVSRSLDTKNGTRIFRPLIKRGYRVLPVAPDLQSLFKDTPAQAWLEGLKAGDVDPGKIPITQNLSNLLRLVVLYKYGGIYLDTDVLMLNDISEFRNSIGIQSLSDDSRGWKTLNTAVLIFDKGHPLLLKFIEEFATNFNGNEWGQNGPYMVTRVVIKVVNDPDYQFNILSPMAFYPVDWLHIDQLFEKPKSKNRIERAAGRLKIFEKQCYGIHLWNKISHKMKIENGSVVGQFFSDHCILCKDIYDDVSDGGKASNEATV